MTRSALLPENDGMPVVFMPQKSQTECERVSRMSSWGFMSFVLSVINGVINISNNINSNNNNRNNNNNDGNNNEYNANVANTNNMQMAGGMAMSMRNIPLGLIRLRQIRDRFNRKFRITTDESSEKAENFNEHQITFTTTKVPSLRHQNERLGKFIV